MYNYTPIKKLYIRNFRNLGDVEISFEESPIVTLVGENEAGKTSVIKAFATCALNANPRDQKDCIRDGTQMFGVCIELEDGTQVTRIKELSGINSYQIKEPSGNIAFSTNKLSEGLPNEVQKLIGLIAEPETNEFLHIRTYEDKLLFVVTPNSTNYKVMYNALKVEQLTKAIKNGSNEVNVLKGNINTNTASIQTLSDRARSIRITDVEPLKNVRDRLKSQIEILDKLESLKNLVDRVQNIENQLGALALLDRYKLEPINEVVASKLNNASRLLNNKSKVLNLSLIYSDIDNLSEIDTNVVNKIKDIIDKKNNLDVKVRDAGNLVHITELSEISEIVAIHLNKLSGLIEKSKTLTEKVSKLDTSQCNEISTTDVNALDNALKVITLVKNIDAFTDERKRNVDYIEQVENYLKQCGVAMESCPKCGEAVIFDIDKM